MTDLVPHKIQRYGWLPDHPDYRDFKVAAPLTSQVATLPAHVDMTAKCPPIMDQGQLGSCVANASGALFMFMHKVDTLPFGYNADRLFIYYNGRVLEGTVPTDSGMQVRDALKVMNKLGCPHEKFTPYNILNFANKPPAAAYADGLLHLVTSYQSLDNTNLDALRASLAAGIPFIFGFSVFSSFESGAVEATGTVPMPAAGGEAYLGGHCMMAVGYDDASQRFICRNSWGTGWGMKGYCTMPYAYLTAAYLSRDFWTIGTISA